MSAHTHVYTHACRHTCTYIHVSIYTRTCEHTTHAHAPTYVYTRVRIHMRERNKNKLNIWRKEDALCCVLVVQSPIAMVWSVHIGVHLI